MSLLRKENSFIEKGGEMKEIKESHIEPKIDQHEDSIVGMKDTDTGRVKSKKYDIWASCSEWMFKSGSWQVDIIEYGKRIGVIILEDEAKAKELCRRINYGGKTK